MLTQSARIISVLNFAICNGVSIIQCRVFGSNYRALLLLLIKYRYIFGYVHISNVLIRIYVNVQFKSVKIRLITKCSRYVPISYSNIPFTYSYKLFLLTSELGVAVGANCLRSGCSGYLLGVLG